MQTSVFDNAANNALDVVYHIEGIPCTYIPYGGSAVEVSLRITDRFRDSRDKPGSRNKTHVLRGMVRCAQVSELSRGDTFQIDDESTLFRVIPSSVSNNGLEWEFEATSEVVTTVGEVRILPDR